MKFKENKTEDSTLRNAAASLMFNAYAEIQPFRKHPLLTKLQPGFEPVMTDVSNNITFVLNLDKRIGLSSRQSRNSSVHLEKPLN